jgi:hypothetical protein
MTDDDLSSFLPIFDEDQPGGAPQGAPEADEPQNRTFLYVAIGLGALFVIGLCALAIFFGRPLLFPATPTQSANEMTNVAAIATATQWAVETQNAAGQPPEETEPPTEETGGETGGGAPTEEPPTETPTPGLDVTLEITPGETEEPTAEGGTPGEGTEVAEVTPGAATPTPLSPAVTNTPGGARPTATGTTGIIPVTQPGGQAATPTRVGGGPGGTPTGSGGPVQPTLPATGFSGGVGLFGAGFLGLALVAVLMIARRMRTR